MEILINAHRAGFAQRTPGCHVAGGLRVHARWAYVHVSALSHLAGVLWGPSLGPAFPLPFFPRRFLAFPMPVLVYRVLTRLSPWRAGQRGGWLKRAGSCLPGRP